MWPIMIRIDNYTGTERNKLDNLILWGVIPGTVIDTNVGGEDESQRKGPASLVGYLYILVDELLELWDGVQVVDGANGQPFQLRARLLLTKADTPAAQS